MKRFDKALQLGDLTGFPNIPYFRELKQSHVDEAQKLIEQSNKVKAMIDQGDIEIFESDRRLVLSTQDQLDLEAKIETISKELADIDLYV
mmetsp:Transcript_34703/g.53227  ORF Transcript_34703/g.53227 Transcript_34703/m.53227 type:complete len:90 (+) Transcript_34703:1161-1430(+)